MSTRKRIFFIVLAAVALLVFAVTLFAPHSDSPGFRMAIILGVVAVVGECTRTIAEVKRLHYFTMRADNWTFDAYIIRMHTRWSTVEIATQYLRNLTLTIVLAMLVVRLLQSV